MKKRNIYLICKFTNIVNADSREYFYLNSDHQRMMVDPMFMIVQNVRSFLTAVTPTAVTPTVVIVLEFT